MLSLLSLVTDFFETANATLCGCFQAPNDQQVGSDAPNLHVLAKALSLVPDLNLKVEVAASCQFYLVEGQARGSSGPNSSKTLKLASTYCRKQLAGAGKEEIVPICSYCADTTAWGDCNQREN